MKKINIVISYIMLVVFMITSLTGCGTTKNTKEIYENYRAELNQAVNYLKSEDNITEITKDRPSFLDDVYYSKFGKAFNKVYYITDTKERIALNDDILCINKLMNEIVYIFVYNDDESFYVNFVTVSKLGESECLMYTEDGSVMLKKYSKAVERLNDNWYMELEY